MLVTEQSLRAFVYVLNGGVPGDAREVRIPPHLADAVAEAEEMLAEEANAGSGALVYVVRTRGSTPVDIRTRLTDVTYGAGGYRPGRATVDVPKVEQVRRGQAIELRVQASNHEIFQRRAVVRSGWIVIWDDIELQPLSTRSAATIYGRIWLEGESSDLGGMAVTVDGEAAGLTDDDGYFVLDHVPAGEIRVASYRKGFVNSYTTVKVDPGGDTDCILRGYRQRAALVRWAYQPDGSRSFQGPLPTGLAVLSPNGVRRTVFSRGLEDNVQSRSDFLVLQKETDLLIRNFDMRGPAQPTFVKVDEPFDRVLSAPKEMKRSQTTPMREGDVFVFQCYEGEHSAKMEVLAITDDQDQIERWTAEVARYREGRK